jgi:DNA-binding NarL/FixJ family response regulator
LIASPEYWVLCGEAADSHETIRKADELRPDVVLLDMSMQPLSSAEVVKSLRELSRSPIVVLMSQQDEGVLQSLADSLSVPHFVTKSHLATRLPALLRSFLPPANR